MFFWQVCKEAGAEEVFRFIYHKYPKQSSTCSREEQGVARPMRNSESGKIRLMSMETGIRTPNAPMMPCSMTNVVLPHPLKYPVIQNKKEVSRQSMA